MEISNKMKMRALETRKETIPAKKKPCNDDVIETKTAFFKRLQL